MVAYNTLLKLEIIEIPGEYIQGVVDGIPVTQMYITRNFSRDICIREIKKWAALFVRDWLQ